VPFGRRWSYSHLCFDRTYGIKYCTPPTDDAPSPCASIKAKPFGCFAALTPLGAAASSRVPAPRECLVYLTKRMRRKKSNLVCMTPHFPIK